MIPFLEPIRTRTSRILGYRTISAVEVLIAGIILVPFTITPVLFFFGWLSLWLRRSGWKDVGLRKPHSWSTLFLIAVPLGIGWPLFDIFIAEPWIEAMTGQKVNLSMFSGLEGNLTAYMIMLAVVWTVAAFVEEMVFRAYLMNRIMDVLGGRLPGIVISLLLSSLAFAAAHSYQGVSGMIETGYVAIGLGLLYLLGGRNLWLPILVHGVYDTAGITLIYLGKYPGLI